MKTSTRIFGMAALLLAQLSALAATSAAELSHKAATHTTAVLRAAQAAPANELRPAPVTDLALNVYPNPSRGLVMVTVSQRAGTDYKLRLSNIIGREVRTFALRPEAASSGMALDLSDLPAGMYFYSLLVNEKAVSTKRFVLQN